MNTRRHLPPRTSASSTSTSGSLWARRLSISVCSAVIWVGPYAKRAGLRPLSVRLPTSSRRHESSRSSIASAGCRAPVSAPPGITASTIAVQPVVGPLGAQRARQGQRRAGLPMASEQLHGAPEAEQRVVVRGRPLSDRLELPSGGCVAPRVKQRPTERLADGGLLRLQVPRFLKRHRRRLVVAMVEQLTAALVEVVHALHPEHFNDPLTWRASARRCRGSPRRPPPWRPAGRAAHPRARRPALVPPPP